MTETTQTISRPGAVDVTKLTLSYTTQTSIQRLVTGRGEVVAWTHNLEASLQSDVDAGLLTHAEGAAVAEEYKVRKPAPVGHRPDAVETTAAANQAQLDAQTKIAEAEAAKTTPKTNDRAASREAAKDEAEQRHEREQERDREARAREERAKISERERAEQREREEKAKAAAHTPPTPPRR
jgi:hypothetical protein